MATKNVLVVDDEAIIGIGFDRALTEYGYQVDSALSGAEALEAVKKKKYDLVFIDKMMPVMDGIETCRGVKKVSPDSICIFMTGLFNKENILKEMAFIEAGGRTYYLYKPFSSSELLDVAQKALGEKKK
ncbi:MAG: response regulator [Candidatus Omnitrophica bacterium]|nr:response regulator [Candidatus Omnitrophota bacterium]